MKKYSDIGSSLKKEFEWWDLHIPLNQAIIVRLDGKAFHKFTRDFEKPFDTKLGKLMQQTTEHLMSELPAVIGYTQSDEITLVFLPYDDFFARRLQKICSVSSSIATAFFNRFISKLWPEKAKTFAYFDSRVFGLPVHKLYNYFQWREDDAYKNAVTNAARTLLPRDLIFKKNRTTLKKILKEYNVDFDTFYPAEYRYGTAIIKTRVAKTFDMTDTSTLPPLHHARTGATKMFFRQKLVYNSEDNGPLYKNWDRVTKVFPMFVGRNEQELNNNIKKT